MDMTVKLGGHRPDLNKQYPVYDKKTVFGSANQVYSGEIDLRQFCSPVEDQRNFGCCVAESVIAGLELKRIQKFGREHHVDLSVLDLYYGCRDLMDPKETDKDNGTHISLACDVLKRFGVCREQMHNFDVRNLYIPPPILTTREAYLNKITSCYKIFETGFDRVDAVKTNLEMGNPVVFGTRVGKNWTSYTSGSDPIEPTKWEDSKGNHAILIVGYVNNTFVIQNSWSKWWGDDGFAYLRPEVIADDGAKDFWVMTDLNSDFWYEGKK